MPRSVAPDPVTYTLVGVSRPIAPATFPDGVSEAIAVELDSAEVQIGLDSEAGLVCVYLVMTNGGSMTCEPMPVLGSGRGLSTTRTADGLRVIGGIVPDDVVSVRLGETSVPVNDGVFVVLLAQKGREPANRVAVLLRLNQLIRGDVVSAVVRG